MSNNETQRNKPSLLSFWEILCYKMLKCCIMSSFCVLSGRMKNLSIQSKNGDSSLMQMPALSCATTETGAACGKCEACFLTQKIRSVKEWFFHFGDQSKKHFMLGLLKQIRNTTILQSIVALLNPTISKDCIYARARTNPSLDTDTATVSSDHAVNATKIEQFITATWGWFSGANYWTKLNFALSCLQMCETHLLHTLYRHAHILWTAELNSTGTPTGMLMTDFVHIQVNKLRHRYGIYESGMFVCLSVSCLYRDVGLKFSDAVIAS